MFHDVLLESSPVMRRRNAWPMATAFTLEMVIASVLVLLPLVSTGVLPLATHTVTPIPPRFIPIEAQPATASAGSHGVTLPSPPVVPFSNLNSMLPNPFSHPSTSDTTDQPTGPQLNLPSGNGTGPDLGIRGTPIPPPPQGRITVSHLSEGMLINKVMPVYPAIAKVAGVQGDVHLHAIIARDGTIQSLTVTSGPEMLRKAAVEAVEQWRYQPYMLNGAAVEVETVIVVSFHKI